MMMSLMSKLLMSTVVATVALSTTIQADTKKPENNVVKPTLQKKQPDIKDLVRYIRTSVVRNPQVDIKGLTIIESKTLKELPGWNVLLTTIDLEYQKKPIHAPEIIFVKDGLVTSSLVNLKTGEDYKNTIKPKVPTSLYNDAHLLFGNKNAAHKLVVFSDPMCPFCRDIVPGIMKAAKENPSKIALYYYHLPLLRIHPVSGVLTRVMHEAQKEKKLDVIEKMYTLNIDARETNATKILSAVQKHTGYTMSEKKLADKELNKAMKADEDVAGRMMVNGTPTVYVDGVWDKSRKQYEALIK